jgi:RNA polymerase sigma factor (sigma-70 family)
LNVHGESFETLLSRVHEGSQDAAWEIIERYGHHIRAVVRRRMNANLRSFIDSDDFVQSVWGSLVRIGPRLKAIDRPEQLIAILGRMAQNKVIDEVRRRIKTEKHRLPAHGDPAQLDSAEPVAARSLPATPSQYAIARERWSSLLRDELPQVRRMIELRIAGHTFDEIAAELNVNERTVRRTIQRLIQEVKQEERHAEEISQLQVGHESEP